MSIILDEISYAENIIRSGDVGKKPTSTLFLLSRYYREIEKLSDNEIFNKLDEFMNKNYKNYNSALWEEKIESLVNNSKDRKLNSVSNVEITASEIESIQMVDSIKYQKILFTMLCFAKFHNSLSDTNNSWVCETIKDVFKVARVNVKYRNDKFLYLNDLERTGLISYANSNASQNIRVNFVNDEGEVVLKISDFRELGYEYLNYIGEGNFVRCDTCDRLVRKKSKFDGSTKYCTECAYIAKLMSNNAYYKKKLNS